MSDMQTNKGGNVVVKIKDDYEQQIAEVSSAKLKASLQSWTTTTHETQSCLSLPKLEFFKSE